MTLPLFTWLVVVTAIVIIAVVHLYHTRHFGLRHDHKLIEIGRDSDEFFIPGDKFSDD